MNNDLYFMRLEEEARENIPVSSEDELQPIGPQAGETRRRFAWPFLAAWLLFALGLGWFGYSNGFSLTPPQPLQAASIAPASSSSTLKAERIADVKVGQRVLTQTPESPHEEPPPFELSDPAQWRLFTLEQQKEDGKTLRIELLRPVVGIASSVLTEKDLAPQASGLPLVAEFLQPELRIPARTIALGADLGWQFTHAPNLDKLLIGKTLHLDLPEMGAVGEAKIVAIAPCPDIEKGQGRVVTGRFIHRAANVVDLLISGEEEPIGTTDNHPFWSEDRQDYVPAGELRVGETLRTVNGSQRYVQSIRPRGPPEDVYNLEVEGAHTYHVGNSGVLVHNNCGEDLKSVIRSQKVADDIFKKGVHFNIGKVELKAVPTSNSIKFESVFDSYSQKEVDRAVRLANRYLGNQSFQRYLLKMARMGLEHSHGVAGTEANAVEFISLIRRLMDLGVN